MKTHKLSHYKLNRIKDNLKYFYNKATEEDKHNGKLWYKSANLICEKLSVKYGYNVETVASVVSALSPRNKWERNLLDAETVLKAVREGTPPEEVRVCTFNTNKDKAFRIAQLKEAINTQSMKTFAFVQNIANLNRSYVTIDVWHMRACFNKMITPNSLTPSLYNQIQKITIKEAESRGLKGYELQAVVWEAIRNSN